MMIDKVHILIQAGNGGNGCESYLRRTDKKVVPNGGDGGKGGSIIFRADNNAPPIANLRFKRHLIAETGGHGGSNRKRGRNGEDLVVLVPPGTYLYNRTDGLIIRDLVKEGDEVVVVEGGDGGVGNNGDKEATFGKKGERFDLDVTVRLTADVAFVGLPNSGKTSLLRVLTASKAKSEDYPFSTSAPELGVFEVSDFEQVKLCDLPSLYQHSHEKRGMGNHFLKHLELVKCIVFVMDPVSQFASSMEEGLEVLREQIKIYNEQFLSINYAIVINKMDLPEAQEVVKNDKWKPECQVFKLSAKSGEGLDKLKEFLESKAAVV